MFSLCESMKWSHLPIAGGLYDQDPDLLDAFRLIFWKKSEYEAEQQKKQERETKQKRPGGKRIAGRR